MGAWPVRKPQSPETCVLTSAWPCWSARRASAVEVPCRVTEIPQDVDQRPDPSRREVWTTEDLLVEQAGGLLGHGPSCVGDLDQHATAVPRVGAADHQARCLQAGGCVRDA